MSDLLQSNGMLSTPIEEAQPSNALEHQSVLAATEALGVAAAASTLIEATTPLDQLDAAIQATSGASQGDITADQLTGLEQGAGAEGGGLQTDNLSPYSQMRWKMTAFLSDRREQSNHTQFWKIVPSAWICVAYFQKRGGLNPCS